jgi:hypothetical protein
LPEVQSTCGTEKIVADSADSRNDLVGELDVVIPPVLIGFSACRIA